MKKILLFLSAFALLFFAACSPKTTGGGDTPDDNKVSEFELNESFELALGQTKKLKDGTFMLTFAEVTQDSRCPDGVNCVRAGEIIFNLSSDSNTLSVTKKAKQEGKALIGGYEVVIAEAMPYPQSGVPKDPNAYVLRLMVRK